MKKLIIGALVAVALAGVYQSRVIHGMWLSRNLYKYSYEPRQEQLQLQARANQLKAEIEAFKAKAQAPEAQSSVPFWGVVGVSTAVGIPLGVGLFVFARRRRKPDVWA